MGDIAEEEGRLAAALDRIESAIAAVAARPAAPPPEPLSEPPPAAEPQQSAEDAAALARLAGELEEARAAVEAERAANAQLVERVRALRQKQETVIAGLERRVAQLLAELERAGIDLARQKRLVEDLTEANAELRAAVDGGGGAGLDRALAAEVAALGALRAADRAEVDSVLGEIRRLIGEGADA